MPTSAACSCSAARPFELSGQLHLGHEDIIPPRMMNLGYMLSSSLIGAKLLGIKGFQDATHGILCDSVLLDAQDPLD